MKQAFLLISMLAATLGGFACAQTTADRPAATVAAPAAVQSVTVEQARAAVEAKDVQFIDVRTPEEYAGGHAVKAVNLPLNTLEQNLAGLDKEKPVYVICQTGRRSKNRADILEKNGFEELYNVEGGTGAWTAAGLPTEK